MKLRYRIAGQALGALLCAAGTVRAQTTYCGNTPPTGPFVGELGGTGGFRLFSCYTTRTDLITIQDDGTLTSIGHIAEHREKRLVGPEICEIGWVADQPFSKITTTTLTLNYPDAGAGCPAGSAKIQLIVKDTRAPTFGLYPQWSPNAVPYTGGNVVLTQHVADAGGVVSMYATMQEMNNLARRDSLPMTLSSGTPNGGDWTVTWRVPENLKYVPLRWYLACVARDAQGLTSKYDKCGYVDVPARPDREPPVVAFTVSTDTLPTSGGDVVGTVQATDNLGVTRVMTWADKPDGTKTGMSYMTKSAGTATTGTWTLTWPLWANTTTAPVSWVLHATAYDAAGNQVSAARTVVVRGKSAAALPTIIRR